MKLRFTAPLARHVDLSSRIWCRCSSTLQGSASEQKPPLSSLRKGRSQRTASLEEALYLAKMAGVFTTAEVQYQIVRGPEFSRDTSPFMLENFMEAEVEEPELDKEQVLEDAFMRLLSKDEGPAVSSDEIMKVLKDAEVRMTLGAIVCEGLMNYISAHPDEFKIKESKTWTGTREEWLRLLMTFEVNEKEVAGKEEWMANSVIHSAIERYFKPGMAPKFWHNNEEWLSRCEGRGTRKRSAAHAVLVRGTGLFRVNGEQDMYHRWPQIYHRIDICQPFKLTGTAGIYDVFVSVRGGGLSGQAGATRLAVSRALFQANPSCHDRLQRGFCLYEDTRQKISKMPGKPGAQSSYTWGKR